MRCAKNPGPAALAEAQDRLDVAALGQDLPVRRLDDVVEAQGDAVMRCHAGISRSTAAMTMLLGQAHPDLDAAAVVAKVHALGQDLPVRRLDDVVEAQGDAVMRVVGAEGLGLGPPGSDPAGSSPRGI
jgi:predicted protein tyrosine phosphatase